MSEETSPKYSAFISYASPDLARAQEICQNLENSGFTCWIAPRNVRPGREYGEEIIHGIQNARCLVLVLSEAANDSTFVRREVERAVSKNKPVFPVRIEDVMPSTGLELFVSTTHWIDAWSPPMERHWEALARELKGHDGPLAPEKAKVKPPRKKPLPKWLLGAASLLAIVLAVALTNIFTQAPQPPAERSEVSNQAPPAAPTRDSERPMPQMPSPTQQREMTDKAMRSFYEGDFLKKVGRPISSLTAKDFTITVEDPKLRGRYQLRINTSPEIKSAMSSMRIFAAIGDGEFESANLFGSSGLVSYRYVDGEALRANPKVRIKFELSVINEWIGPFEYQVEIPDSNRLKMREEAKEWENNGETIYQGVFSLNWSQFWPVVKSIRYGWDSADALDHRFEFTPLSGVLGRTRDYYKKTPKVLIPAFYGKQHIFIQFELDDGTLTETRKVAISFSNGRYGKGLAGQLIQPAKAPEGAPPLPLVLGACLDTHPIKLLPLLPAETVKLRYSFDPVGFFDAKDTEIEASSDQTQLFISYETKDGQPIGPYEYHFKPSDLMRLAAKRAFKKDIKERLKEYEVPEPGKRDGLMDRQDWFGYHGFPNPKEMDSSGWGYVIDDRTGGEALCWFGVKQIEMGTRPDQLEIKWQSQPVDFVALFSDDSKISGPVQAEFLQWHAAFPIDSPGVFVRYTFYDGEQSEVIRLR